MHGLTYDRHVEFSPLKQRGDLANEEEGKALALLFIFRAPVSSSTELQRQSVKTHLLLIAKLCHTVRRRRVGGINYVTGRA